MNVSIAKCSDGYGFKILEAGVCLFDSWRDSHLVAGLDRAQSTFGDAYAVANRLVSRFPSVVAARRARISKMGGEEAVRPEDEIVAHFSEQVALLESRWDEVSTAENVDRPGTLAAFVAELEGVSDSLSKVRSAFPLSEANVEELDSIQERLAAVLGVAKAEKDKFPAPTKTAGEVSELPSCAKESVVAFAEDAARGLSTSWPEAYLSKVEYLEDAHRFVATISCGNSDLCLVSFNDDLFMTGILPCAMMAEQAPYHSKEFYDRCWLPVVFSVGHFLDEETGSVMAPRCGADDKGARMYGFSLDGWTDVSFDISTGSGAWMVSKAQGQVRQAASKFTEDQLLNAEVMCTRQDLPTYYGRTGTVISVVPRSDYADVTVDFRRGLGQVVLTDSDIELTGV